MITKEFKLDGKVVIPMRLRTQVGKSLVTGTFYVYEDEGLAKKHINPTIFSRLEKAKAKIAEADAAAKEAEVADAPAEKVKADAPAEKVKADAPAEKVKKEEKSE
jgi:ribosomal protein S24E